MSQSDGPEVARNGGEGMPVATDLTWDDFEHRVALVLERMATDTFLILSTRPDDEQCFYVQFAQGGRAGFRAEAESNNYLVGRWALSPIQEEQLADLGWQAPLPGEKIALNFMRQWPMPTPFADVAGLAVRTLREVYGIDHPSELVYRRFAKGGHDFAEPSLGIQAEKPTTPRGAGMPAAPTLE